MVVVNDILQKIPMLSQRRIRTTEARNGSGMVVVSHEEVGMLNGLHLAPVFGVGTARAEPVRRADGART